jgi:hypothetical protein
MYCFNLLRLTDVEAENQDREIVSSRDIAYEDRNDFLNHSMRNVDVTTDKGNDVLDIKMVLLYIFYLSSNIC